MRSLLRQLDRGAARPKRNIIGVKPTPSGQSIWSMTLLSARGDHCASSIEELGLPVVLTDSDSSDLMLEHQQSLVVTDTIDGFSEADADGKNSGLLRPEPPNVVG